MEVRITTLIENQMSERPELFYEHGLSLFIETMSGMYLFDTGQSGDFIENAKSLGKDLHKLDAVILSHGHYDHTGGVKRLLLELSKSTKIFVGSEFFEKKYKYIADDEYKYIGNAFTESDLSKDGQMVCKIEGYSFRLSHDITIFHHFKKRNSYETIPDKFVLKRPEGYVPDGFPDEISLGIKTSKGLVVVVGCSHVGVVNIVSDIQRRTGEMIYALIGGTHLVDADKSRRDKTIQAFKELRIQKVAVSHCTGEEGIKELRNSFKEEFILNNTGNTIVI